MKNLLCASILLVSFSVTANDVAGYKIEGKTLVPITNSGDRTYHHEGYKLSGNKLFSVTPAGNRTFNNNNFNVLGNKAYKSTSTGNRIYGTK
jgi:hypothetical protein